MSAITKIEGLNFNNHIIVPQVVRGTLRNSYITNSYMKKMNAAKALVEVVDLSGSRLEGADFTSAKLSDVYFNNADLTNVDFSYADIDESSFYGALLTDAKFKYTKLHRTSFHNFKGSLDLSYSILTDCSFNLEDMDRITIVGAVIDGCTITADNQEYAKIKLFR
jgi:uncharacterized protein YjbI with pentapeptide repeats